MLTKEEVAEIRHLREQKWELEKIAAKFGITGSAASRVCGGSRHVKVEKGRGKEKDQVKG